MRERFSIEMRTEITNQAREWVQAWQKSRLPPVLFRLEGMEVKGGEFSSFSFHLFF